MLVMSDERYSIADQKARFDRAKRENNRRYLDITTVYDPSSLQGQRVAVTGANKGLGLALAAELTHVGAEVIAIVKSSSSELEELGVRQIISGIDVTDDEKCAGLSEQVEGGPIDILINNVGFLKREGEQLDSLDFPTQIKTIDISACGHLRVTSALLGLLKEGSKVIMITSQAGSIGWREVQSPNGGNYGHHMSKASANMLSVLLANEVKNRGIAVGIFHPGFQKTDMTSEMKDTWESEGAVDPSVGAKRVLYETIQLSMEKSGKFRNCEDGLEIPW
ncbi:hypothetical protein FisN_22Hu082 [Fistulifera solaris]|uniref:Uncharacterized protein n=1 Tax=Fistulifera solaris TaxID=1519565 RepID=A0A1Z5K812_FISSO|nr:hypothetical protein FisN_22Hu082 [Fistulifera solaris]|eukprot:GAX22292.1 hypothetical protein FisN_22Hu082 [Fistulifera solaris]